MGKKKGKEKLKNKINSLLENLNFVEGEGALKINTQTVLLVLWRIRKLARDRNRWTMMRDKLVPIELIIDNIETLAKYIIILSGLEKIRLVRFGEDIACGSECEKTNKIKKIVLLEDFIEEGLEISEPSRKEIDELLEDIKTPINIAPSTEKIASNKPMPPAKIIKQEVINYIILLVDVLNITHWTNFLNALKMNWLLFFKLIIPKGPGIPKLHKAQAYLNRACCDDAGDSLQVARNIRAAGVMVEMEDSKIKDTDPWLSGDIIDYLDELLFETKNRPERITLVIAAGDTHYDYHLIKARNKAKKYGVKLHIRRVSWESNRSPYKPDPADEIIYLKDLLLENKEIDPENYKLLKEETTWMN